MTGYFLDTFFENGIESCASLEKIERDHSFVNDKSKKWPNFLA